MVSADDRSGVASSAPAVQRLTTVNRFMNVSLVAESPDAPEVTSTSTMRCVNNERELLLIM